MIRRMRKSIWVAVPVVCALLLTACNASKEQEQESS